MLEKKFVPLPTPSGAGDEGGIHLPPKGIFEKYPLIKPTVFENADTTSPKEQGGRTTKRKRTTALIVHPEFPLGYE